VTFWQIYGLTGLVLLFLMTALWLVSLLRHDASIVDPFWGVGFVLAVWIGFALTPGGAASREWLIVLLVTLWGMRLSLHIWLRNRGRGEDFRYRAWRTEHGERWWWRSYFQVFLLQGLLLWIISAPLLAAQLGGAHADLNGLDLVAVLVWGVGFYFETVGDRQLARFRADPANRGRVLKTGLWRFTRHPNYFGDAVQWWAYYLIALAAGGWVTIFSPVLMTFLLVRVSGVALLEKSLKDTKPGYQEYVDTTSAFIPWFPRKHE
jgi:steroid 5-alpha reductase family enzyme